MKDRKAMTTTEMVRAKWFKACRAEDIPADGGSCVKYRHEQIAIFYFARNNEWYATQNQCPHKMQMVLSRGMTGDQCGEPKVACPFHKKAFSLKTGRNLSGDDYCITTYPVKVENGYVYIDVSAIDQQRSVA